MSSLMERGDLSLGYQVELFTGETTAEPVQDATRYNANGRRWLSIVNDPTHDEKFCDSLSDSQLSSHHLLTQWLILRQKDPEQNAEAEAAQVLFAREQKGEIEGFTRPTYHYYLTSLFNAEFAWYPDQMGPASLRNTTLSSRRRNAALYASCYKMALQCCAMYNSFRASYEIFPLDHSTDRPCALLMASAQRKLYASLPLGHKRQKDTGS